MGKALDLRNQRFGRLVAAKPTEKRRRASIIWHCICDCGNECFVTSTNLQQGYAQSCGCLWRERVTSHNMCNTPIYLVWSDMISRCENSNHHAYKNYGGRGIRVCERWHDFRNFFADMGEKPEGLTIERRNNEGNYNPGNCYWATWKEQQNNKRPISCGPNEQYWFRAWHKDMMCQFMSNNQNRFAKKHSLDASVISQCLLSKRKQHKGWSFQKI